MKKILAVTVLSLAASSAFASVKLLVRSDYMNTQNYSDSNGTTVGGDSVFVPTVARMYLSGNVGDAVVDAGLNLRAFIPEVSSTGTLSKTMTPDSFVEHLTIAKSWDAWNFSAGKLYTNVGGFERQKMFAGTSYLTALAVGQTAGSSLSGTAGRALATNLTGGVGTIVTPDNMSGVAAAYNINADHKLEVQLTNQTNSQTVTGGDASIDKRNGYGLQYSGSVLNKMIQILASYNIGAADTYTGGGQEEVFWNAGVRLAPIENLTVDLEYLDNTDKHSLTGLKDETSSAIVEARYKFGMWTPVVKYENSKDKAAGADNFTRNAFAIALELTPKDSEAFSYHIAWSNTADQYKGNDGNGSGKVTDNTILVGFTYTGDIVK